MVSIIVPVYKVETFIRECIDSVLAQTYIDFELLLVDDGSPDSSPAICEEYASVDSRVRVLHKSNGGLSSARNCGMAHARGKWVVFLDSDDMWGDKGGLNKLVDYAEKYNLDILRFEYQSTDENGNYIYPRPFIDKKLPSGPISNFDMVDKAIAGEWFAVLYLIRRDALEDMRFDEECKFQEDIDFYAKLFARKEMRCGYVPEKIYRYRKRESSITTTSNVNNLAWSFHLCDVFYEQSKNITDSRLQNLYVYNAVMMYYWTLVTLSEEPYFRRRKDIIRELSLSELWRRTRKRLGETKVSAMYKPFIIADPKVGIRLLGLKNKIVSRLSGLK